MSRAHALLPLLSFALLDGCAPRPQMLFVVDMDALVAGAFDPTQLSAAAAIDTVRVDVLNEQGGVFEVCELAVTDPSAWPLSFGIVSPPGQPASFNRVRVRGFRRAWASPADLTGVRRICGKDLSDAEHSSVSEPLPAVTIDRVVDFAAPSSLDRIVVRLSLGCMGIRPSFAQRIGCVDEKAPHVSFDQGVQTIDGAQLPPSRVGSAALARFVACDARARPKGASNPICVPGGFSIMGDNRLAGDKESFFDPVPLRAVWLSPFYLDATEVTVDEMRDALARDPTIPPPSSTDPNPSGSAYCDWSASGPRDARPINCVSHDTAAKVCALRGGALPTEAQWEYAARGRGLEWLYPWGNDDPQCCTLSAGRLALVSAGAECKTNGAPPIEPVGSHQRQATCSAADVSIDGVLDLGGSVAEYLADSLHSYADRCGLSDDGPARDPLCTDIGVPTFAMRGADWSAGTRAAAAPLRNGASLGATSGFRCAYRGVP